MPKGRKFIPTIGDMVQTHDAVAICTDMLTSTISDKQVYELLFLKDNSTQYMSLAQLNGVKRATPENMRTYMFGNKVAAVAPKPVKTRKAKVGRRKRTKADAAPAVEA